MSGQLAEPGPKLFQDVYFFNFPARIFAAPVTDDVAPGYSQIIKSPMDFSTIKIKNGTGLYKQLKDFTKDFTLMSNNCMTYNNQETIYYKVT